MSDLKKLHYLKEIAQRGKHEAGYLENLIKNRNLGVGYDPNKSYAQLGFETTKADLLNEKLKANKNAERWAQRGQKNLTDNANKAKDLEKRLQQVDKEFEDKQRKAKKKSLAAGPSSFIVAGPPPHPGRPPVAEWMRYIDKYKKDIVIIDKRIKDIDQMIKGINQSILRLKQPGKGGPSKFSKQEKLALEELELSKRNLERLRIDSEKTKNDIENEISMIQKQNTRPRGTVRTRRRRRTRGTRGTRGTRKGSKTRKAKDKSSTSEKTQAEDSQKNKKRRRKKQKKKKKSFFSKIFHIN